MQRQLRFETARHLCLLGAGAQNLLEAVLVRVERHPTARPMLFRAPCRLQLVERDHSAAATKVAESGACAGCPGWSVITERQQLRLETVRHIRELGAGAQYLLEASLVRSPVLAQLALGGASSPCRGS